MSIKIKLTTEGNRREPYVVEIEVGQDTIVASLDLVHAIISAVMASEEMRNTLSTNMYAWGVALIERLTGKMSGNTQAPPWTQGAVMPLDLPPDIKNHIMETVMRYMNKTKPPKPGNKFTPNKFDFSSLFAEDKVEPPDDEGRAENKDKDDKTS